jgi:hypothetical protein
MFRDYAERGQVFKKEVEKLAGVLERPERGEGPPPEQKDSRKR